VTAPLVVSELPIHGYGNIGDDLMLSGFLHSIKLLGLTVEGVCARATNHCPESQALRFPQVMWNRSVDLRKGNVMWAVIGDTPFQLSWGDWLLRLLQKLVPRMRICQRRTLICVGAESEIAPEAKAYGELSREFDRVSTRDAHTFNVLEGIGYPKGRMREAADLANVSLPTLFPGAWVERKRDLGIVLATETMGENDLQAVGRFVASQTSTSAFVAGDMRAIPNHEVHVFKSMKKLGMIPRTSVLEVPPYRTGSLAELVAPISENAVVISSRYHCLLAAAWSGCRVAAISRTSKVGALAEVLGCPSVTLPLTEGALRRAQMESIVVGRRLLDGLREKALEGVRFCMGGA
jgi:hypothetical protein